MDNYHITKKDGEWKFKKEGADRSIKNFKTKTEAIVFMMDFMSDKVGSVKIHKANGQFQEERTYQRRNDPKSTKG